MSLDSAGHRLRLVTEVLRSFADATTDYARLLQTIVERVAGLVGHASSIRLLAADGQKLETAALYDPAGDPTLARLAAVPIPITAPLRSALDHPRAYVEELASQRGIDEVHPESTGAPRIARVLIAPLVARGAALGCIFVVQRAGDGAPFTPDDVELVDALAHHAALALANARLLTSLEAVERARAHERSIIDTMAAPLLLLDRDGLVVGVNRAFTTTFGAEEATVVRRPIFEIVNHAFDTDAIRDLLSELPPSRPLPDSKEVVIATPAGERTFLLRTAKTFRPGNGSETTLLMLIDLTERIAAAALAQRRSLLIASMSEALIGLDRDFKIEEWNPAAERLFGWTADEVHGAPIDTVLVVDSNRDREELRRQVRAGNTVRMQFRFRSRAGAWVEVEASTVPIMGPAGPSGYVCVMLDVTEQRRLGAELHGRVAALTDANRELESFSYSVSHDLRAPVRAIDGFAEILEQEHAGLLDDEGKRILAIVRKNAKRMGLLIDDLLALARCSRQPIVEQEVDMDALARATLDEVLRTEPDRTIAVRMSPLPSVRGDESLLRQVWVNLYSNAVKYTRGRADARIETFAIIEDGHEDEERGAIRYIVKDNGAGFDMRHAGKLFGTFERLHSAKEFEGTGIGLALIARIVNRHGGQVRGAGEVDKGATFEFSLPKTRKETS